MSERRRSPLRPADRPRADRRLAASVDRRPRRPSSASTSRAASSSSTRASRRRSSRRSRSDALQRALDIMRQRVDAFGVAEPELARSSATTRSRSTCPASRTPSAPPQQVGSTAQLFFYDWESERPRRELQDQPRRRSTAASSRSPGLYNGRSSRPSKCKHAEIAGEQPRPPPAPRFYAFDKISKQPLNNGQPFDVARGRARRRSTAGADGRTPRSSRSRPACSSLRDEKADAERRPTAGPLVGHPATTRRSRGTDIKNPEQNFDQQAGNEPIVTFDFTDKGRKAFQDDHAQDRPARRRQRAARLQPDPDARSTSRSRSTTSSSRRRTSTTARTRTASTARPAPRSPAASRSRPRRTWRRSSRSARCRCELELISRSQVSATLGKQALDQGLIAGIAGFVDRRALPDRLLPRPRRHRDRRAGHLRALLLRAHQADPDHADAAGHRGPDPHARRRGRREHRHLRARQGGGARRADRSAQAIVAGYRKGLTAIVDANIVTFLVAFILFILATAGVKGFAFMLGLGVIVSLFTAVLATQAILYSLRGTRLIRSERRARRRRAAASRSASTSWASRSGSSRCPA